LITYRRAGTSWRQVATTRLRGTFFWKTLTGPHAICDFDFSSAGRPRVTVPLLQTPALGCGRTQTVSLDGQ
jgi:hypothetical protein